MNLTAPALVLALMPSSGRRALLAGTGVIVAVLSGAVSRPAILTAQSDLDAFMQQVVARRDDNWRKLQQYVLDEREVMELRGPGNTRLWGEEREYTWFIRDGFFIRSPIRFNGVTIGEDERQRAEAEYLRRAQRRDARARQAGPENAPTDSSGVGVIARPDNNDNSDSSGAAPPTDVDAVIRQVRQPQFVSSAYFLRFKFDAGTYALVGREQFEGRDVLRVEYYPTRLYEPGPNGRRGGRGNKPPDEKDQRQEAEFRRVLNKVALITLWIEPSSHQIVKYTFDNINFDFLPGQWLVHVDSAKASMTMGQPFKDVWLPKGIDVNVGVTLASGEITFRENVTYHDYREATVTTKVGIPGAKPDPRNR
jgi:hypothetical protein